MASHDVQQLQEKYNIKIENKFEEKLGEDFQCFGCSRQNKHSVPIHFFTSSSSSSPSSSSSDLKCVFAVVDPLDASFSSFPGIVHGGIVSTIIDDVAFWTLFHHTSQLALTVSLQIKFVGPAKCGSKLYALGTIIKTNQQIVDLKVDVFDLDGRLLAVGDVQYALPSLSRLKKVLGGTVEKMHQKL